MCVCVGGGGGGRGGVRMMSKKKHRKNQKYIAEKYFFLLYNVALFNFSSLHRIKKKQMRFRMSMIWTVKKVLLSGIWVFELAEQE